MKIMVFNDTKEDWIIHAGSALPISGDYCRIPKCRSAVFEVPDGQDAFVMVWNKIVYVSFQRRVT